MLLAVDSNVVSMYKGHRFPNSLIKDKRDRYPKLIFENP